MASEHHGTLIVGLDYALGFGLAGAQPRSDEAAPQSVGAELFRIHSKRSTIPSRANFSNFR